MACFHPLSAYLVVDGRTTRNKIRFKPPGAPVQVPCGQCIGCRLDRSLEWAVRCMHEAQQHQDNCFITLTYSPENLPPDGSLVKGDFQKFMKRLRKRVGKLRYFQCGEYGEQLSRPHYHACIFGYGFPDKTIQKQADGYTLYKSELLQEIWPLGYSTIGDMTFETAAYVARYCTKKITGEARHAHYVTKDGVVLEPEYSTMSRRPGIGRDWYERFSKDVFPWDECILRGKRVKPPRYYTKLLEVADLESYQLLKAKRLDKAKELAHDNTPERLAVKEQVKESKMTLLKRGFENGTQDL